jgi:hypothetical protein
MPTTMGKRRTILSSTRNISVRNGTNREIDIVDREAIPKLFRRAITADPASLLLQSQRMAAKKHKMHKKEEIVDRKIGIKSSSG